MKENRDDTKYSVAILCGGNSTRMGQDKAEMQAGGMRMVDRLLAAFSGYGEILLSVRDGKQRDLLTEAGQKKAAQNMVCVTDPIRNAGPLAGIVASLRACREEWLFVTAVDMPYMDREFAEDLFAYRDKLSAQDLPEAGTDAIVPVGMDGHVQPMSAFYSKKALPVLEECLQSRTYSLWRCFQKLQVTRVPVSLIPESGRKLVNLNRPEDLEACMKAGD